MAGTVTRYKIDNELYDHFGDDWWNPRGQSSLLHELNPVRFNYFREVLGGSAKMAGLRVLDVGCGGGLLSEEFALCGATVTGVDISASSLTVAQNHATSNNLEIKYLQASADELPFSSGSFDAVACCDFLEHVSDRLDIFMAEIGRVLRPGGIFLYDTINRTMLSRLVAVGIMQDWLRIVPRRTHDWKLLIKPAELEAAMRQAGIEPHSRAGIAPTPPPARLLKNVFSQHRVGGFGISPKRQALTYVGYGYKPIVANKLQ